MIQNSLPAAAGPAVSQTFITESRELLLEMEDALLALSSSPGDARLVDAVFRAAHTIKGSSGMFGLDAMVAFTHVLEGAIVDLRAGCIVLDEELVNLLLACGDHLDELLDAAETGAGQANSQAEGDALIARLASASPAAHEAAADGDAHAGTAAPSTQSQPAAGGWRIVARFAPDVLRQGMDPLSILRYLATLGEIGAVTALEDGLPAHETMDPETCYLGLELQLRGDVARADLEAAFEYVSEGSTIRIDAIGEPAPAQPVPADADPAQAGAGPAPHRGRVVRVDAGKLDDLITLVGELVIASASVSMGARNPGSTDLVEAAADLNRLVEEVRDGALVLRMVPIGDTFSRFHRVVHDLGATLAKKVDLVISGAEAELDKSMVQMLGDPLMHLVRNAMDHGIEPAGRRLELGKPARGRIMLNAYHETGSIVIEVGDDGAGLDREKIRSRAVQAGLIAPDREPDEQEIHQLLMEPGFSTAEAVSNVSGRGVGMDVVRRNVEALRGSVAIRSVPGEGTVTSLRVPLTLAIVDGFLVQVGSSAYVVPLDMVVECLDLADAGAAGESERGFASLRGDVLPLLRLRDMFGARGEPARRQNIVVVQHGRQRAGFVVDALLGEFQTVIKPLGKLFERLAGISGSTILGTGEVALILDVQALVEQAVAAETSRMAAASPGGTRG